MNTVLDQMTIDIDRYREKEKERQAKNRMRRQNGIVTEYGVRPTPSVSRNMGSYEHLHGTPSISKSCRGDKWSLRSRSS